MQCAICGAEAEDITPGGFDGIATRCKKCGKYEIADSALNAFLSLSFENRNGTLEPGTKPCISTATL